MPEKPLVRASFCQLKPILTPVALRLLPERVWQPEEWARIRLGLRAESTDARWNVLTEGDLVYLHRSRTGNCIYELTFTPQPDGHRTITKALAESDPGRHHRQGDPQDCHAIEMVLTRVVLSEG